MALYPGRLHRGDKVAVLSPAGPVRSREGLDAGIARLQAYIDAGADIAMAFGRDDDLRAAAAAIDAPLSTITGLDHHTPEEWSELGFSLVIDAFTAQALAVRQVQSAYASFQERGTTGVEIDGMGLHRELVELCKLEPLLELERRTTERPL